MAIAQMQKVMVVTHHSEAGQLLEALQREGIVQILNAEKAMVTKAWPELHIEIKRPGQLLLHLLRCRVPEPDVHPKEPRREPRGEQLDADPAIGHGPDHQEREQAHGDRNRTVDRDPR